LFFAVPARCGNLWALEKEQMLNKRLTAITVLSFLYGVIIGLLDCVAKIGSQLKNRVCKYEAGTILDRLMALSWANKSLDSWKIDQGGLGQK
jgi:hypothetical protein